MGHIDEILKKYREKYIDKEKNLYVMARGIKEDYKYFLEFIRRSNKKSPDLFSFDLRIANPGLIWDFFWRKIKDQYYLFEDTDYLENALAIFFIANTLIHAASKIKIQDEESVIYSEILEFESVIKYFMDFDIHHCLISFKGCSRGIDDIQKKLESYRSKIKKTDSNEEK